MAAMSRHGSNKLLGVLRDDAYRRLEPKLRPAQLHAREILYKPNEAIREVYFPESAVICLMTVMANGDTVEAATVGLEGASWISASIGAPSMPCETVVAIAGSALALDVAALDLEMTENEPFRAVLTQYSHALLIHSLRMTACSALHSLPQRCARWILTTLDRVPLNRFAVTHEFLAMLLGASRPSVSAVLEDFQRHGILDIARGQVSVVSRERLHDVTCECYAIIRSNYEQVGRSARQPGDQPPAPR
jgi:CRP-like cAMP-binding protein